MWFSFILNKVTKRLNTEGISNNYKGVTSGPLPKLT